jgi:hypothetical protein
MIALALQLGYARAESRDFVISPIGFLHRQRGAS